MDKSDLVSIICTVFNQEDYILECLESVANQDYENFELIILENGSKDQSPYLVKSWVAQNSKLNIHTIFNSSAISYCENFNKGLGISKGKYVIDLSGDDLIRPSHIKRSTTKLQKNSTAAFCFCDANLFEVGKKSKTFYQRNQKGTLLDSVNEGNLYKQIVAENPILSATLVFDAAKLKAIGGYDEGLSYEDFDIMVRLSREYMAVFSDHVGINKRIHPKSFSKNQYLPKTSIMLPSTLKICQKIKSLNENRAEDLALLKRVMFEAKHALWSANFDVAVGFLELAKSLSASGVEYHLFRKWSKVRVDLSYLYLWLKK
ncbi:glycosyltransferase family 2 protein [Belliella sp. R4-6]|uniref:Glycosyltransferase family 2 protein n=1 Tax=Belliella alkalica TaxID=1730871 RepID=A0ABS9VFD3_9BACT|nr:glycosyltransferase family A protein [Belliella alkalica]MCH7415156.1 glycosyltransferase family 2 protein [Belliella alkalica]